MARTSAENGYIKSAIGNAMARAGLPPDHPIAGVLDFNAKISSTGRDFYVTVQEGRSLDDQIRVMRKDARYFPQPSARVDHRDINKLRESFDDIASGKTVVE
jgi:hypothetical protein